MITGDHHNNKLYHEGIEIPLERSLKVRNHSPTGFNWGYHGSGPSQAAIALLLHFGATNNEALSWYQEFKREIIANLPQEDFTMEDIKVIDWLAAKRLFVKELGDET